MRSYITGHDIANTVRMSHTQRRITFLLVEGESDLVLFSRFVDDACCEILVSYGKVNALLAAALLDSTGDTGWLCVVDADFDRVEGRKPPSPNCIAADFHDLEVLLLTSVAFDRVVAERGSRAKVDAFEKATGRPVREVLFAAGSLIGSLRWLNERRQLDLDFQELNFSRLVDRDSLQVDFPHFIRVVAQRSRATVPDAELLEQCNELLARGHDTRNICQGHDVVEVLAIALRHAIGSQNAQDVIPQSLAIELRLAFDGAAFETTDMYQQVRGWEARNEPWRVLAA